MAKRFLKAGDEIFATGVHLQLQEDGSWKVMGFEDDSFFDGETVNDESSIPEQNKPFVGEDDEDE